MKITSSFIPAATLGLLLAPCASVVEKPPANADYGPVPKEPKKAFAVYLGVPPESIDCREPRKAYRTDAPIRGGKIGWYGYAVRVYRAGSSPLTRALQTGAVLSSITKNIDAVALFVDGKVAAVTDYHVYDPTFYWVDKETPGPSPQPTPTTVTPPAARGILEKGAGSDS